MKARHILEIHPLLADRSRLAIMAALIAEGEAVDFNSLSEHLSLTRGNLSSHMSKLEEAELVEIKKEIINKKMNTSYTCTEKGKKALAAYIENIQKALMK